MRLLAVLALLLATALPAAAVSNEWCRVVFSDLNRSAPLGTKKRGELQNCLWVRYVSGEVQQGRKALDRAAWEQKTRLDALAADSQLVAAWQSDVPG